jgi:hypothetical protein
MLYSYYWGLKYKRESRKIFFFSSFLTISSMLYQWCQLFFLHFLLKQSPLLINWFHFLSLSLTLLLISRIESPLASLLGRHIIETHTLHSRDIIFVKFFTPSMYFTVISEFSSLVFYQSLRRFFLYLYLLVTREECYVELNSLHNQRNVSVYIFLIVPCVFFCFPLLFRDIWFFK